MVDPLLIHASSPRTYIKGDKVRIVHVDIEGLQVIFPPPKITFLSLKIIFDFPKSADPIEIPHHAEFYLGLHCLPRYPLHSGLTFS